MEVIDVDCVDSGVESSKNTSQQDLNPWPHLSEYFKYKSKTESSIIFQCELCSPKIATIKAHTSSFNNLKQHVKRAHSGNYVHFEEMVKAGSIRRRTKSKLASIKNASSSTECSSPVNKRPRQRSIGESFGIMATGSSILQSCVDRSIVHFFVANMIPLHVVESDSFENLIKTLNPTKSSLSRRTLGRRIVDFHTDVKQKLIRLLAEVDWVATTADCWSSHNKSYLGMTVHWLNPKTRARMHAVLACKRIRGVHSYDVLAHTIINIHYEFNIERKVSRTTTDNGSNFVKAFVQFGTEPDTLTNVACSPLPFDGDNSECNDAVDMLLNESGEDQEIDYVSLEDVLVLSETASGMELPVHMRCSAHTFNLIATKDSEDALHRSIFKLPYRSAMAKARALWNHQSRSTVASESIISELGRKLIVPNSTRWNSTYDSLVVLNGILQTKRPALYRIMSQFGIQYFNDQDVLLMDEYVKVMSPVAKALDHIQGEAQAYLGTLLPTVAATIIILKEIKGLVYCTALVDALIAGVDKRFGSLMEDEECQLAAAFHPKFRLFWLKKNSSDKAPRVKKRMEAVVEEALKRAYEKSNINISSGGSSSGDDTDDFFSAVTRQNNTSKSNKNLKNKAKNLVSTWLSIKSKNSFTDADFLDESVLIELFIRYNQG